MVISAGQHHMDILLKTGLVWHNPEYHEMWMTAYILICFVTFGVMKYREVDTLVGAMILSC